MKIKIELNDLNYRYDVYQMVNLFYGFHDIEFVEQQGDYKIEIGNSKVSIEGMESTSSYDFEEGLTFKESLKKSIFSYFTALSGKVFPWGTLVGIRPSKIALSLMHQGKSEKEIAEYFAKHYSAREDKSRLCMEVAKTELEMVNKHSRSISVYIGMPFCPTRCLYCSFTSNPISGCKKIVPQYLEALRKEISEMGKYIKEKNLQVECVYFGGGTPTSVDNEQFENIMNVICSNFVEGKNVKEFNVECGRPDSITREKLLTMKKYGVQRISINPQSMNDHTLKAIGRNHSVADVAQKYHMAREMGFDSINMDMIVGLPGEGLMEVENTCRIMKDMNPDNLTVHGMSVKRGSKLHENLVNNEKFHQVDQAELNAMYQETVKLAGDLGMKPYYMYRQKNMVGNMENVGYSQDDKFGIYNIEMIEDKQTIIACGADAVTKVVFLEEDRIERAANVKDVREYIGRIDEMIDKKINLLNSLYI